MVQMIMPFHEVVQLRRLRCWLAGRRLTEVGCSSEPTCGELGVAHELHARKLLAHINLLCADRASGFIALTPPLLPRPTMSSRHSSTAYQADSSPVQTLFGQVLPHRAFGLRAAKCQLSTSSTTRCPVPRRPGAKRTRNTAHSTNCERTPRHPLSSMHFELVFQLSLACLLVKQNQTHTHTAQPTIFLAAGFATTAMIRTVLRMK